MVGQNYRIDHIHLRSPKPAEAAAFYHRMFGADITTAPRPDGGVRQVLKFAGTTVYVDPDDGTKFEDSPADAHYGLDHFGVRVDNIHTLVAELTAKGIVIQRELRRTSPTSTSCVIQCPDNVRIELVHRDV